MLLQIQSTHFDADEKLLKMIKEKFHKLEKLYDRIEKCNIVLRNEKNDHKKKSVVRVRLVVPKGEIFANENAASFEQAIEMVIADLKKQIIKLNEKRKKKKSENQIIFQ